MKEYGTFELKSPETPKIIKEFESQFKSDRSQIIHTTFELCIFYEMAYGMHSDQESGYIYQSGIWQGGSLCAMGLAVKQAIADGYNLDFPIIGIDRYRSEVRHYNLMVFKRKILEFDLHNYICPILQASHLVLSWNIHPARLILIDTEHTYDYTKKEIENALPLIAESAWMLLHDFGHEKFPGVRRAVEEFLESQKDFEILDTFYSVGEQHLFGMHLRRKH